MNRTEVQAYLDQHIPIVTSLGVRVERVGEDSVDLSAPLHPNINHESTAFGGSISALAILAGWTHLCVRLRWATQPARIVIQHSHVHYVSPVRGDFIARARSPKASDWAEFADRFERRGKGRIVINCDVEFDGRKAAAFEGTYVALK